ncbi:MAG TPA: 50S ribosomal protein L37ae [Halobacteriales archaeon]|jgi:large subunit ribosomal protein L37Ae|nr:50S ribosomal protein L37ae [Halobacteriales archaeon]|tara:strand:+ start:3475 stop:3807 length:333 start_codon:yes stop_codon:yes gene_type:complete
MAKKSGSAGRFGARYGRVARRRVSEVEALMRADYACPKCGASKSIHRVGTGIWECRRKNCDYRFAGGTYRPATPGGLLGSRSITRSETEASPEELLLTAVPSDSPTEVEE